MQSKSASSHASATANPNLLHDNYGDSARVSATPIQYVTVQGQRMPVYAVHMFTSASVRTRFTGKALGDTMFPVRLVLDCPQSRVAFFAYPKPGMKDFLVSEVAESTMQPTTGDSLFTGLARRFCNY
jgi:hypothetical protein